MKKLLALIVIAIMVGSLVACGNKNGGTQKESTQTEKTDSSKAQSKSNVNTAKKNILVVFFSQTGNTKIIANEIHESVGGDIFQIKTVKPYPTDNNTLVDQAKKEQDENYRPKLAAKVNNINSYDTVFIGYPDWWHTMPMPVFSFLEQNNLSGKTIIPFCTHEGSGFGQSLEDIKKIYPKSTILQGLAVRAKDAKNAKNDVSDWLHKIGMTK